MAANLSDIFGKSGDFQFSFSVQDLISPAIENIDKAAHSLMSFFDKMTKKMNKSFDDSTKALTKAFKKQKKDGTKAVDAVGDSLKDVQKETKDTEQSVLSLGQAIQRSLDTEQFRDAFKDLFTGKVTEAAEQFNGTMRGVANTLGKNRTEMTKLSEDVINAQASQNRFGTSAFDAMESIQGLVDAGVRNEKMLRDLAPRVSLVANAVGGDKGSIAAAFYEMEDRLNISGPQITRVFANWKQASETTATSFEGMREELTDPEFFQDFSRLTRGMSEENRAQMLTTLGNIRASFADEWAASSDFIGKIVGAMTDPRMAAEVSKMTGMAAHEVKAMLQTTEGAEQFFSQFIGNVKNAAQAGDGALVIMEEALGFTKGSLVELVKSSDDTIATFRRLQGATVDVGEAQDLMVKRSQENLTMTEKLGNAFSDFAAAKLPLIGVSLIDIFDAFADIPFTEVFAFGAILSSLSSVGLPTAVAGFLGLSGATATLGGAFTLLSGSVATGIGVVWGFLWPVLAITGAAYVLYRALKPIGEWFFSIEWVEDMIAGIADGFEALLGWVTQIPDKVAGAGEAIKKALKGAFDSKIIETFGEKLNFRIPLTGKTLGEMLGFGEVPQLAMGGIATGPVVAQLAEGNQPEVVMPLDRLAAVLSQAGYAQAAAMVAPAPARSPNVIVAQDKVVSAVERLTRTLENMMKRSDLPSKGSAFGNSPLASPRGF